MTSVCHDSQPRPQHPIAIPSVWGSDVLGNCALIQGQHSHPGKMFVQSSPWQLFSYPNFIPYHLPIGSIFRWCNSSCGLADIRSMFIMLYLYTIGTFVLFSISVSFIHMYQMHVMHTVVSHSCRQNSVVLFSFRVTSEWFVSKIKSCLFCCGYIGALVRCMLNIF